MTPEYAKDVVTSRFSDARVVVDSYDSWHQGEVLCGYMVKTERYEHSIGYGSTEDEAWVAAGEQLETHLPGSIGTPILAWRFEDAPVVFRELSPHGGDEDWVAFIPEDYAGEWIGWLEYGSFGVCSISRHPVEGGEVRIGAHA